MWGYNLFYEDTQITNRDEDDCEFETEDECYEDAEYEIDETIKYWESEGSWRPENGDSRDYFSVEPFECEDKYDDEIGSSQSITASYGGPRIENMYDVKDALEEVYNAVSYIEDDYFDIDETDPRYILKRYLYDIGRHIKAAYNAACTFTERDN